MASPLTPGQTQFARTLARLTGLNSRALSAWMLAEESGGAAAARQRQGNHNWLNIAYYDSGPGALTKSKVWSNPQTAARYTADFLKGERGGAAPGIRAILRTAGSSPDRQLDAIAASPWASSHYGGASRLKSILANAPAPGAAPATSAGRGGTSSGGASSGPSSLLRTRTESTFDTKGFEQAQRKQALAQLLTRSRGPRGSVLLRTGAISTAPVDPAQFEGTKQVTERVPIPGGGSAGGGTVKATTSDTAKLVSRANAINAKHLPYQWGGGHAGRVNAYKATPLDCSGAVSAVLGINPRVSGQFEKFGKPGDGGNRGVTIYANSEHVLMKINGHFFGTSQTNPGGGAGWIKQRDISPEYLKRFTARHL